MRKFFQQDKNYILYGAQIDQKDTLLVRLVDLAKQYYQLQYNPLGLLDDTIMKIKEHSASDLDSFDEFYDIISAFYRYKNGNNQLEFLFDGMDHYTKYSIEWQEGFELWANQLFGLEPFLKTVLQLTVFDCDPHSRILAVNRLNHYLTQHFNLKVYKYKGIVEKEKAA